MNGIHTIVGIATVVLALATVVAAFLPAVKPETLDQLVISTAGVLIVQVAVGFFLFTNNTSVNFAHIALPVASLVAILVARASHGDRQKTFISISAVFVLAAAVFSFLTGNAV